MEDWEGIGKQIKLAFLSMESDCPDPKAKLDPREQPVSLARPEGQELRAQLDNQAQPGQLEIKDRQERRERRER